MKNLRLAFIISFLFVLLFLNLTPARIIQGEVDITSYSNESYQNNKLDNIEVNYYFNSGEKVIKITNSGEKYSLYLNNELFCYVGCNIVPRRIITQIDVLKESEILSTQEVNIENLFIRQIINIVLDSKVELSPEEINNFENKGNEELSPNPVSKNDSELIIEWNGELRVDNTANYSFRLDEANLSSFVIDGKNIELGNDINLEVGEHNLSIIFFTNKKSLPNLLWRDSLDNTYSKIEKTALI